MNILVDKKKSGKKRNWQGKKISSLYLSECYLRLGNYSKAGRMAECGSWLEFKIFTDGEPMKLHKANFCKIKLCPMCAMRRTDKIFGQVSKVTDYINKTENYKYIFLTLTIKNVPGDGLSETLDKLFDGFKSMTKRRDFKALSKGWFRCLEVTHNWERDDYHPHIHMIIAVNPSYFSESKIYMSHKKWMDMWRDCMGLDYDPWVDIRTVKPFDTLSEDGTIRYNKAVAEVAKYTAKPSDYIVMWVNKGQVKRGSDADAWAKRQCEEMTDKAVSVMDAALHGRRLIAFGGKLRDVHKLLNLDDPADGDLINTDNEEKKDDFLQFVVAKFYWNVGIGNYVLVKNTDSDNES